MGPDYFSSVTVRFTRTQRKHIILKYIFPDMENKGRTSKTMENLPEKLSS